MYCSSCGNLVNNSLRFCNHCGAGLTGTKDTDSKELSEASFNTLIGCIIAVPIAGLGLILGMMVVMKEELGFSNDVIIAFTAVSFLLMAAAEAVFIWLLVQRTRKDKKSPDNSQYSKEVVIRELSEGQARGLSEPIPAVTEHTTRHLEPVLRDPNGQDKIP